LGGRDDLDFGRRLADVENGCAVEVLRCGVVAVSASAILIEAWF
jgi:hypothetical protein